MGGVRGRDVVPRQNGKGTILEARELAGLFLLGERLLIHSAHEQDTSLEHFRRLLESDREHAGFDQRVLKASEGERLRGDRAPRRAADQVQDADEAAAAAA
jgi:hypothetical protein